MSVLSRYHEAYWDDVEAHVETLLHHEDFNKFAAEMIRYQMASGGKRIRPTLVIMATEALGGDPARGVPFAATVELIHNASLVHDDIQDQDTTRRGRPAAWVAFSTEQAINLGDLLFVLGFEAFSAMEIPDSLKLEVMRLTIRGIGELVDGQVYEFVLKEKDRVSVAEYERLVSGKTGSLFRLALRGGHALSEHGGDMTREMKSLGEQVGILFQIRDDLLDTLGRKEGRPAGSDVEEGKISYPAVHYMSVARDGQRERLLEVLRMPRGATPRPDIEEILDSYRRAGSLRATAEAFRTRKEAVLAVPSLEETPRLREGIADLLDELDPGIPEDEL